MMKFLLLLGFFLTSIECLLPFNQLKRIQSFRANSIMCGKKRNQENDEGSNFWLESLKARQQEITQENYILEQKWRNADCSSQIKLRLPDWTRRLDVEYPLAACGSASGHVYVANVETGEIIATTERKMDEKDNDKEEQMASIDTCIKVERVRELLHYGAGMVGTVDIAFAGDLICVSNPLSDTSSVQIWRMGPESSQHLLFQGYMVGLEGIIVTCLELDEEYLWVGTADGDVFAYSHTETRNSLPLALQTQPKLKWKFQDSVLSLSLQAEIGHGLVTTATGSVELISIDDDGQGKAVCSLYPPLTSKENILTAILTQTNPDNENSYAIIGGGGDGSIWIQPLNMDQHGEISEEQPFKDPLTQISPPHLGPVKCLSSPVPGLLVSGGLDGSVRVWDIEEGASLYQFVG